MMKRILTLSLLAIACITMQAQTTWHKAKPVPKDSAKKQDVKLLARCDAYFMAPVPEATVDKKTKKKTVVWPDTENNSWHENIGFVKNVPTISSLENIFPDFHMPEGRSYLPVVWQLTEERHEASEQVGAGDETSGTEAETVLHCYFRMPADVVTNLWLCSDECVILDKETGTIYQSRRTNPDCYGKVFSVKEKEGTILDFQIFFPKLPETTKEICIYGVPNWYMRGMDVSLSTQSGHFWMDYRGIERYDEVPIFHQAHLVSEAKDYNKDNYQSWAVYNDAHLIKPVKEKTYAMWCTPEATYLAEACEMNWMREYFGRGGNNILVDQRGHQYKCKDVLGYPNNDLFWVEGYSGDYFAIVMVFEPIPMETENITYIVPEGEPFAMWGANWSGSVQTFNIKQLRDNQKLFEYHPRKVVR